MNVKKRLQQLVSCFLALCLTFGGTVALSPVLHLWIEHGGKGAPHTHLTALPEVATVAHSHDAHPSHAEASSRAHELSHLTFLHSAPTPPSADGLFAHDYEPFRLPDLSALRRAAHDLIHVLEGHGTAFPKPGPSGDGPGHQHHSLPQLLASGLIELHLDVPLLQPVSGTLTLRSLPIHTTLVGRDWDAQSAPRGPPSLKS